MAIVSPGRTPSRCSAAATRSISASSCAIVEDVLALHQGRLRRARGRVLAYQVGNGAEAGVRGRVHLAASPSFSMKRFSFT